MSRLRWKWNVQSLKCWKCSNPWIDKEFCGWLVCVKWPGVLGGKRKFGKLGWWSSHTRRETKENLELPGQLFPSLPVKVYVKCLVKRCEIIQRNVRTPSGISSRPQHYRPTFYTPGNFREILEVLYAKGVYTRFVDLEKAYDFDYSM